MHKYNFTGLFLIMIAKGVEFEVTPPSHPPPPQIADSLDDTYILYHVASIEGGGVRRSKDQFPY